MLCMRYTIMHKIWSDRIVIWLTATSGDYQYPKCYLYISDRHRRSDMPKSITNTIFFRHCYFMNKNTHFYFVPSVKNTIIFFKF